MKHRSKRLLSILLTLALLLALLVCLSLTAPALAVSPEEIFTLELTSDRHHEGHESSRVVDGGLVKVWWSNDSGPAYNETAKLYLETRGDSDPLAVDVCVYLEGHEEETRQTLTAVSSPLNEYACVVLHVNVERLWEAYGKGEDTYSRGDGWHHFRLEVRDAAGGLVTTVTHAVMYEGAYQTEEPADPRDTPEVFSFTDSYGRLSGQWLYAGGTAYAYRCYFTLVTGPNGGDYTMTFPYSRTEADEVRFTAEANSVYKLTYTYPLSGANANYSYTGSIPWKGPNGTSGSFRLSFSGGQVSAGELAVEQLSGAPAAPGFRDVPSDAYYAAAVDWAVGQGITNGTSATAFSPLGNVTRAQAVTFLWRAQGCPEPQSADSPFTDVREPDAWYYHAVLWAVEQGITNGTSATIFSPEQNVTRGQMLTFLYRSLGEPGKTGAGAWYADAERWASANGLLDGTAVPYTTGGECPRSDVVYYLWKAGSV